MANKKIFKLEENDFSIIFDGKTLIAKGNINVDEAYKVLNPFFNKIHDYVIANKITAIDVDLIKLKFLNSGGIKELVNWVVKLERLPINQKYKITFLCSEKIFWQETSVKILKSLSPSQIIAKTQ